MDDISNPQTSKDITPKEKKKDVPDFDCECFQTQTQIR
jgi:hypothetical protein